MRIWKDIFYKYFNLHFSYQWHWALPFSNEKPFILPFLLHNILCSFFPLCCHFFLLICWPLHILRTLALYSMFCKCVPFVVWFLSWFMLCVCFCFGIQNFYFYITKVINSSFMALGFVSYLERSSPHWNKKILPGFLIELLNLWSIYYFGIMSEIRLKLYCFHKTIY